MINDHARFVIVDLFPVASTFLEMIRNKNQYEPAFKACLEFLHSMGVREFLEISLTEKPIPGTWIDWMWEKIESEHRESIRWLDKHPDASHTLGEIYTLISYELDSHIQESMIAAGYIGDRGYFIFEKWVNDGYSVVLKIDPTHCHEE